MSRSTNLRTNSSNKLLAVERLQQQTMNGWKTREIGVRQGANHSQVRPRTAEQGPRLRGCDPVAGCKRTDIHRVLVHTYAVASPEGPLLRAPVRTPGEDSQHSMAPILVGFSAAN